jgi:hypothetical protein
MGQKRKCRRFQVISALPHKADINCRHSDVRFVPIGGLDDVDLQCPHSPGEERTSSARSANPKGASPGSCDPHSTAIERISANWHQIGVGGDHRSPGARQDEVDDRSCNHVDAGTGEEHDGVVVPGCIEYASDGRGGKR